MNGSGPSPGDPVTARHAVLKEALLDADGLAKIPPPEPLVEGLLFVNTLAWISGKPGCAKTFAALDLSCCIGSGLAWHGRPVKQGTVLYVIAEGAPGLGQRAGAWAALNNRPVQGVTFLPVPVQLADGTDAGALAMLLAELKPALVVVDTQARATSGLDENSSKDMGLLVAWLDHLRQACGACMLLVHHTPRNAENLRGSTALEGAADTILAVTKDGPLVTIRNDAAHGGKQKNAAEATALALTLVPAGPDMALSSALSTTAAGGDRDPDDCAGRAAPDRRGEHDRGYRGVGTVQADGPAGATRPGVAGTGDDAETGERRLLEGGGNTPGLPATRPATSPRRFRRNSEGTQKNRFK